MVGVISITSSIQCYLGCLQLVIWDCKHPFCIGHIRAHTELSGPLSWNNEVSDLATRDPHTFNPIEATNFHSKFHVNASTLKEKFKLTRAEARDIAHACPQCVTTLPATLGTNPKGLVPNHIWQVDVTHIQVWEIGFCLCFGKYLFQFPYGYASIQRKS